MDVVRKQPCFLSNHLDPKIDDDEICLLPEQLIATSV